MVMMLTLPAIWAGLMRSWRSIAVIAVLSVAVITPDIVVLTQGRLTEPNADRAIMLIGMLPLVMILVAIAAHTMASILIDRQLALKREREQRAAAAAESERSRFLLDTVLDSLAVGNLYMVKGDQDPSLKRDYKDAFELD